MEGKEKPVVDAPTPAPAPAPTPADTPKNLGFGQLDEGAA